MLNILKSVPGIYALNNTRYGINGGDCMSSTNRSKSREKHISDYYVTPQNQIESFLKAFEKDCPVFLTDDLKILDPCAGGDALHDMSYPAVIKRLYNYDVDTIDIRPDSRAVNKYDYLEYSLEYKPDIIITNPPFNQAIEIIETALDDVKDDGYVIMLLRLNFFGSKVRFPFFQKYMPLFCYVHHERMSFTDDGKTDSIEYCHMVFRKGYTDNVTYLRVI